MKSFAQVVGRASPASAPASRIRTQGGHSPPYALPIEARRHSLIHRVEMNLRRRCALPAGARVVLGVSGGADSTALLIAMTVLRDRETRGRDAPATGVVRPIVAHVNHQLRPDAGEDAAWVESLCKRLFVPFRVRAIDPGALPGNLYENARRLRYRALAEEARAASASHIAVAHHVEDQFETILMNLCRGCDVDGIAGMSWSRPLEEIDSEIRIVRPLLDVPKAECESLCRAAGIVWRDDRMNRDPERARSRLRQDVLPVLGALWPGAAARAAETAASIEGWRDVMNAILDEAFGSPSQTRWERAALRGLPHGVIAAGLRRALLAMLGAEAAPGQFTREHFDSAAETIADDSSEPRQFDWPQSVRIHITAREVWLGRSSGSSGCS